MDVESLFDSEWYFAVELHIGDDKCGVPVSTPDCPVLATTYNKTREILPANTEIIAGDHDY